MIIFLFIMLALCGIAWFNYAREAQRRLRAEYFLRQITMVQHATPQEHQVWVNLAAEWIRKQS